MSTSERRDGSQVVPCTVGHVTDFYRRYPGEPVTFYTRVEAMLALPGYRLRVHVPEGLIVGDYWGPSGPGHSAAQVLADGAARDLYWIVRTPLPAGTRHEYQVRATVGATDRDAALESVAVATVETKRRGDDDGGVGGLSSVSESVEVAVKARGEYLKHLPAIYDADELMGRLLMLFESFWAPIDGQVDNLALYFDPRLTPPDFLPWLASWLSLVLDERWPEEKRRRLLHAAASLYRRRGTKEALVEYLEIYTDATARIIERRANDFRLGSRARLGAGLALGRGNLPHTFEVALTLPRPDGSEAERKALEQDRRRIEAIIRMEKPVHTAFTLQIESR